ncbi:CHAP domain-containing protein, partial [Nonomuraea sp. NPDC050536]|uniref:CHAP domain-containing protein n=1 Tax=Nonomuraea sp. NPDC050536 TaxID=3364366 RepID=UPI0037C67848
MKFSIRSPLSAVFAPRGTVEGCVSRLGRGGHDPEHPVKVRGMNSVGRPRRRSLRGFVSRATAAVLIAATTAVIPAASASASATVSRDKIVSIAHSQLGKGCSSTYDGISCDREWCAAFATWVWGQAGVDVSTLGWTVTTFVKYGDRNGTWHDPTGYTPQPGDAMIFGGPGFPTKTDGGAHVGFVESVHADGTLTEIGGNQSGHVTEETGTADQIESNLEGSGYDFLGYVSPVGAVNPAFPSWDSSWSVFNPVSNATTVFGRGLDGKIG